MNWVGRRMLVCMAVLVVLAIVCSLLAIAYSLLGIGPPAP